MSTTIKPETTTTPAAEDALITVVDTVYLNRWVTLPDGTIVKFVKSRAQVTRDQLSYFQSNKEFTIMK